MKLFSEIGALTCFVLHGIDEPKIVPVIEANMPLDVHQALS